MRGVRGSYIVAGIFLHVKIEGDGLMHCCSLRSSLSCRFFVTTLNSTFFTNTVKITVVSYSTCLELLEAPETQQ